MTTAKELRAAAERELDSWNRYYRGPRVLMARHILATVHADDDEPVTDEYVASQNPPKYWEAGREYSWPEVGLRYALEVNRASRIGQSGFYMDRDPIRILEHIKTRGQMRLLFQGLGIELKGEK